MTVLLYIQLKPYFLLLCLTGLSRKLLWDFRSLRGLKVCKAELLCSRARVSAAQAAARNSPVHQRRQTEARCEACKSRRRSFALP